MPSPLFERAGSGADDMGSLEDSAPALLADSGGPGEELGIEKDLVEAPRPDLASAVDLANSPGGPEVAPLPKDWWDARWTTRRVLSLSYELDTIVRDMVVPVPLAGIDNQVMPTARVVSCAGVPLAQHVEGHGTQATLWIRVPELEPMSPPCLWLYTAPESSTELPDSPAGDMVFDDETLAAWHFDAMSSTLPQAYLGVQGLPPAEIEARALVQPAEGVIGGAVHLSEDQRRLRINTFRDASFPQGSFTLEMWIKADFTERAHFEGILDDYRTDGPYLLMRHYGLVEHQNIGPRTTIEVRLMNYSRQAGDPWPVFEVTMQDEAWNHVAVTLHRESDKLTFNLLVNGVEQGPLVFGNTDWAPASQRFWLGDGWPGQLDEVRLSKVARSAAWLQLSRRFMLQEGVTLGDIERLPRETP